MERIEPNCFPGESSMIPRKTMHGRLNRFWYFEKSWDRLKKMVDANIMRVTLGEPGRQKRISGRWGRSTEDYLNFVINKENATGGLVKTSISPPLWLCPRGLRDWRFFVGREHHQGFKNKKENATDPLKTSISPPLRLCPRGLRNWRFFIGCVNKPPLTIFQEIQSCVHFLH